jgi:hypothetical protein
MKCGGEDYMSYLDEVPDVNAFIDDVINNVERYRLFDREKFVKLIGGVLSDTNVDSTGESISVDSLKEMEDKIRHEIVWVGDNHDPRKPPVGRFIAAKVFYARTSQVHFLAGVAGIYDTTAYPKFTDFNIDLSKRLPPNDLLAGSEEEPFCHLLYNPHDISARVISDLYEDAPDFISPPDETLLHKGISDEHISQIIILASNALIAFNPLTKEFFSKVGQAAGDAFIAWIKRSASTILSRLKRRVLFKWDTEYLDCKAEFIVDTQEPDVIAVAVQEIADASSAAGALVRSLKQYDPERVVYLFNATTRKWFPLYAVTKRVGVISDRPYLIALERYKGFSIGGTALRDKSE